MKELSIEEKAKRYDEALERARQFSEKPYLEDSKGIVDYIFPELKESEGEKIRKEIISALKYANHKGVYDKHLAWLEKQGEQKSYDACDSSMTDNKKFPYGEKRDFGYFEEKPTDKVEPKFRIGDFVKNTNYHGEPIYEIVYIDKECYICEYRGKENMGDKTVMHFAFDNPYLRLIEQNPSWSEEDETGLTNTIIMLKEGASLHFNKKDITKAVDWLNSLKDRVQPQPKQEWSEEDEEIYRRCICSMRASACGFPEEEKFVEQVNNWFNSLKDRVQPKQQWSEEDEMMIKFALTHFRMEGATEDSDIIKWLKSLRPQKQWKPSDEQVLAINTAINACGKETISGRYLIELQEQLKKLREE